ncbi:RNA dependent RNA polymerase-domain-containing protein [Calycina marina]|uniref:RNA-dependent RNA polymerase n=1 Tax=Calycina marina TaxID=1763456 RepID=A0A9P7Z955_9HELO|nr:RNA dependent RNA polymerase-domain-containing protein [Calycina marina]
MNLHPQTSTYDLYRNFNPHGDIVFIEIFEGRSGARDGSGRVKFSPPPHTAFWQGLGAFHNYSILSEDGTSSYGCHIELQRNHGRMNNKIQSPFKPYISYESPMKLIPTRVHFGTLENLGSMVAMHTIDREVQRQQEVTFEVDLAKKRIVATFDVEFKDPRNMNPRLSDPSNPKPVGHADRNNKFMFQIDFSYIDEIYLLSRSEVESALVISLKNPPQFYRKRLDEKASHSDENLVWTEFDTWYRQTDIIYDPYLLALLPVKLHKESRVIDIGRWTTYAFDFNTKQNSVDLYNSMKSALQDHNIEIVPRRMTIADAREPEVWSLINRSEMVLPFQVRYQLEVCISRNLLNEFNISEEFVRKLLMISATDAYQARNILEYVAEQDKRVFDPVRIFEDSEALAYSPKTDIPHYCAYARKATVSPTTIYYSTPTVETTNRVLRRYARENLEGRFLRVQFVDELSEGRINSSADKKRNDEVFTRVYRTLYNGITIGDRHYKFLAFGNSQFRENGAYFFCETEALKCDDIRAWMGNFKHINVVAKYAARLGQCFSTTRAINGLSAPTIEKIDDVEINGYCFTDGVGKISPFLAQIITAELGLRVTTYPSAFQFRLGGCKGILVVSPDAKEKEVHIRPSQEKFTAVYNGLEIIRWSRFSTASLNRQIITILSSLGVPDEVFLQKITEQLENYQIAMNDNALAQSLLVKYIDDNQMTINIATMINNGFMTSREPFVLSLLHLWRAWSIKLLKEKAKIIVEDGAFLLGCIDETDTLRGHLTVTTPVGDSCIDEELPQIFVQVPCKEDPTQYNVIEGICLVGRNPSLHPGDLRVVQAVNVKALHHLRDVVVFPRKGERDVPSMCSGGDLDGDDFFVIWDAALQPPEWNVEPMSYDAPTPVTQSKQVRVTDLMKFFVRYMKNDALPTIAVSHLGQSDLLDRSVKDHKCLELAALHSKAVDYVKTGQPAEMPKRLRLTKWPHFMEKKHKRKDQIYTSHKILGQLYDKVESVNFTPQYQEPFDIRILRAYKLEDSMLKIVRQTKNQYDTAMRRAMAQHEIRTEFEVWTTFILSKPRVGSDYKIQETMAVVSDALKDRFRQVCIERAGGNDFTKLGPFVAGMYKVTKEELDIALAECRRTKFVNGREQPCRKMEPRYMPLISFPWLFEKELGRIATGIEGHDEIDSFFPPSVLNNTSCRRGGGAVDADDFIQMEDGRAIHRGEELDLFHAVDHEVDDEEEDSSDFGESRSVDGYRDADKLTRGKDGELVIKTESQAKAAPQDLLSGTGVEDVVPRTDLEGLINPMKPVFASAYRTPLPAALSLSAMKPDYGNLAFRIKPATSSDADKKRLRNIRRTSSTSQVQPEDRFSGSSFEPMDTPNVSSEDEAVEEQVKIEIEESALEKLQRLMDS